MRKGNITVTLDKDTYIEKVKEMLQDKETYETIKKDPTNKFTKNLRTLLARWKECNYRKLSIHLLCSDGSLPRVYALPKINKSK